MVRCFFSIFIFFSCAFFSLHAGHPSVTLGMEVLLEDEYLPLLKGKKVGLITNHTAINPDMKTSIELMKAKAKLHGFTLAVLFAPEHGITGASHASEKILDEKDPDGIPIFSLHGTTRRPTPQMLASIDVLVYDIQDIGARAYTYITTLFYAMEECAKAKIPVIVTDRPNPINGVVVDGPMLEEKWRSFLGYVNVPYCHGMTIGELALFFNQEYHIGCNLHVIPMKGWKRRMTFMDTGLPWIPTSPNIPEASTTFYYPMTGILGELQIVNIGVGYPLPFKIMGSPWIDAERFSREMNKQKLPGLYFYPFHFKPFYGRFSHEACHGILIYVNDPTIYKPVLTQYVIIGLLKSLYPKQFQEALTSAQNRKDMFCKVNGTEEVYNLLVNKKYVIMDLKELHKKERENFLTIRQKYLVSDYKD